LPFTRFPSNKPINGTKKPDIADLLRAAENEILGVFTPKPPGLD